MTDDKAALGDVERRLLEIRAQHERETGTAHEDTGQFQDRAFLLSYIAALLPVQRGDGGVGLLADHSGRVLSGCAVRAEFQREAAAAPNRIIERWRAIIHAAWHMLDDQEQSEQDADLLKAIMDYSGNGDIHEMLKQDATAIAALPRSTEGWVLVPREALEPFASLYGAILAMGADPDDEREWLNIKFRRDGSKFSARLIEADLRRVHNLLTAAPAAGAESRPVPPGRSA